MTDKRIVYNDENGCACILIPDPNYIAECSRKGMTEDESLGAILKKDVSARFRSKAVVLTTADLPPRDHRRNAWTLRRGKVEIDEKKAAKLQDPAERKRTALEKLKAATGMSEQELRDALG